MEYFRKIFFIIQDTNNLIFLLSSFILLSILDLIGITLLIPFASLILFEDDTSLEIISFLKIQDLMDFNNLNLNSILVFMCILILFIFIIKFILSILLNYFIFKKSQTVIHDLRLKLVKSFQNIKYENYLEKNSSFYVECITVWTWKFGNNVVVSILKIINDGLLFILICGFLAYQDFLIFITIALFLLIFGLAYTKIFKKILIRNGKKLTKLNQKIMTYINESFTGYKDFKVYNKEFLYFDKLSIKSEKYKKFMIQNLLISSLNRYLIEVIFVCTFVAGILFILIKENTLLINSTLLLSFAIGSFRLLPVFNTILHSILKIKQENYVVENLYKQMKKLDLSVSEFFSDIKISEKYKNLKFKTLELKNVSFNFNNSSNKAINNISLKINCGDRIAIIGPSGSGKTTIINIILGLLIPQKGKIFFNGVDIKNMINICKYIVGYVPQDIFIMDDDVFTNITLEKDIDKSKLNKVKKILRELKLEKLFNQSNNGIYQKLGQSGSKISGGQKQRISLARSLYSRKKIIILDEATSALDYKTENEIYKLLNNYHKDYTFIVVTHKRENLKFFDKIIEIENGKIKKKS